MIRKNFYIQILRYAHEKDGGFILDEIFEALSVSKVEKQLITENVIHDKQLLQRVGGRKTLHGEENEFSISSEGRFRLLAYEQLESANKAALRATWIAIASIIISTLATIVGFFVKNNDSLYTHKNQPRGYIKEIPSQWRSR
jgi:hypothetical protein